MKLKAGGKFVLIAAVVGILGYGLNLGINHGYFAGGHGTATQTIDAVNVPTTANGNIDLAGTSNINIEPSKDPYTAKLLTIPWNEPWAYTSPTAVPARLRARSWPSMA